MCNSIAEMNGELAKHNDRLAISFSLTTNRPDTSTQMVEKIAPRGKKKPLAAPTYCPFCGEKYPDAGILPAAG